MTNAPRDAKVIVRDIRGGCLNPVENGLNVFGARTGISNPIQNSNWSTATNLLSIATFEGIAYQENSIHPSRHRRKPNRRLLAVTANAAENDRPRPCRGKRFDLRSALELEIIITGLVASGLLAALT
jgi:hypothetical protein